ncbi:MAG: DegV family protein [Erysipelotrichaceae bacterium]|jgi:DegV family protein with EDD domain|nr:DegV family protein [Erysipelotrichaceae bacterium]
MAKFQIFTDSCCDLPTDIRKELGIEYFPMGVVKDGKEMKADIDWVDYTPTEFYNWMREGIKLKTTQISVETVCNLARPYLEKGIDILYLGCTVKLTGSINSYNLAKEILLEEFPDRRMEAVETTVASALEGMLACDAKRLQDSGKSLDEVMEWVEAHKSKYNYFCTTDTLTYLKAAGRVSGASAFFGNIIGVKPVFISDKFGNNLVIAKARGTKASMDMIVNGIKETMHPEEKDYAVVLHADAPERAEALKERFQNELGIKKVYVGVMGPIVGITCGPGTIAGFCYGKEVTRYEGDGIATK